MTYLHQPVRSKGGVWLPPARHPLTLYVPPTYQRPKPRPIALDFFCGAGGFSLGFLEAGWEVVGAFDYDAASALTYLYNLGADQLQFHFVTDKDRARFEKALLAQAAQDLKRQHPDKKQASPEELTTYFRTRMRSGANRPADLPGVSHFWFGDVRLVEPKSVLQALDLKRGELDCVFGGPPCQGFSTAGKRDIMDPRNSLIFDFARFIVELSPKTFVMENVPGLLSMVTPEGIPVLDAFCRILADGGFGAYESLKRSLAASPTARGAVRRDVTGPVAKVSRPEEAEEDVPQAAQLSLLEAL